MKQTPKVFRTHQGHDNPDILNNNDYTVLGDSKQLLKDIKKAYRQRHTDEIAKWYDELRETYLELALETNKYLEDDDSSLINRVQYIKDQIKKLTNMTHWIDLPYNIIHAKPDEFIELWVYNHHGDSSNLFIYGWKSK